MSSQNRKKSNINITPYIDILLVLLIIFMVIQPVARHQLAARAPQSPDPGSDLPAPPSILLAIESDFILSINGQALEFQDLGDRLFDIYSSRWDKRLFVRGAEDLSFGSVVRVIDVAKSVGVGDIGLLSE